MLTSKRLILATLMLAVLFTASQAWPHRRGIVLEDTDASPALQVLGTDLDSKVLEIEEDVDEMTALEKKDNKKLDAKDEAETEEEKGAEKDVESSAEAVKETDATEKSEVVGAAADVVGAVKSSAEKHDAESDVDAVKESGDASSDAKSELESIAPIAIESDLESSADTGDAEASDIQLKDLEGDASAKETAKATDVMSTESESTEALGVESLL